MSIAQQELFNHMDEQHNLILLESEMNEIEVLVLKKHKDWIRGLVFSAYNLRTEDKEVRSTNELMEWLTEQIKNHG